MISPFRTGDFQNTGQALSAHRYIHWITNIENTASFIESEIGAETVDFVLKKYGAKSIDQIASSDLAEVYSELYAIEADLRSG